jgi:ABC-type oligopeptide transport system substrate-binding subunit
MKTLRTLILFCAGMLLLASLFSCNKSKKATTYSYTCTVYLISFTTGDTSVYFQNTFIDDTMTPQQREAELLLANPNDSHNFLKCQ